MRKLTLHDYIFCLLLASTIGATGIFLLGMTYTGGVIDINALYNQYGWKYGEGWSEVSLYIIVSIIGIFELARMRNKAT